MDVGIDLGTATVIIYIGGEGVVLKEPSVVAVNMKPRLSISVGEEAYKMTRKPLPTSKTVRPVNPRVLSRDYKMTEEMVKYFHQKICKGQSGETKDRTVCSIRNHQRRNPTP